LKPIALSLFLALSITPVSGANPVDWVVGAVVVSVGNGNYQVWHSANPTASKPSYTTILPTPTVPLNDGVGGTTPGSGCAFDSAYRLFTTNFANSKVARFSVDNGHLTVPFGVTSPGLTQNESLAFDAHGHFFVGYAGTSASTAGLAEYNHDGTLVTFFSPPATAVENRGIDWIDLASDGQTVFYTSEGRKIFTFNGSAWSVYADLSTLSGAANKGKLFAIRILTLADGSFGGVLVADQTNVKLVKASNGVISSVQVFKFKGESDLEALSLDPTNSARFWVGDATTNDLTQFDMNTGKTVVTLNTNTASGTTSTASGTHLGGVCVDGGLSAAQNSAPNATYTFTPVTLTQTTNTISFTSPFTGAVFTATLANLQTKTPTVTVHDSLVDPSVAASDETVFSFNPGNGTSITSFTGPPLACDQTLTTTLLPPYNVAPYTTTPRTPLCEVFEFEANPSLDTTVTANVELSPRVCPNCPAIVDVPNSNPRLLRNLDEDITDGINTYPLSGTRSNCVYTVNNQTFTPAAKSCGFESPIHQGQTFTTTQGSAIPFKFVAVSSGTCPPSTSTALGAGSMMPLLMITQLVPPAAPTPETVIVKGNSGGFPVFTFSGNTWQLQVDTTNLAAGGTYLATVIDLFNNIPAFNITFHLN
jgi:hypothetical protein